MKNQNDQNHTKISNFENSKLNNENHMETILYDNNIENHKDYFNCEIVKNQKLI